MHRGASLQGIKVNNTAYCGSVRCGRASRRPRRTVSARSKDLGRTGPEYVSSLSGSHSWLRDALWAASQPIWIHIHVFYTGDISSDYHMATEARRRPSSSSRRGSLSGPLVWQEHDLSNALGLLSQVHTLLSLCLSYQFSPLRHGLSLWISLLFAAPSQHPLPAATPHLYTRTLRRHYKQEGNNPCGRRAAAGGFIFSRTAAASTCRAANHRSGGRRDVKSGARGVTCLCSLTIRGCRCNAWADPRWQAQTAGSTLPVAQRTQKQSSRWPRSRDKFY